MKEREYGKKIYKDVNPSSIIDYMANLPRKNSLKMKSHINNYQRSMINIYSMPTIESKASIQKKITLLNPVVEKRVNDEESSSSSNNSNKSKDSNNLYTYKNNIKHYKSVSINNQFNNIKKILSSKNLYNCKTSKKNIRNSKYINGLAWTNENNNLDNYSPIQNVIYPNFNDIEDEKLVSNLNKNELDREKQKKQNFQEKIKEMKIKFYGLISYFYFSLYLLCLKISLKLSMPKIPALGVSLFIICFNNLIISIIFINLDQVNFQNFINSKFRNFLIKIFINYLRILLVTKGLQHINLLSFILIINMTPIIVSYISIREKNQSFNISDTICYIIFIIICFSELLVYNKTSIICTFTLMFLNTFTILAKINILKNIHSYLLDFWSALIGIAISPLIMSINEDNLNISISQYLLFIIISFTYFLNHYFEIKFSHNSLGQGFKIFPNSILFFLYILYSNFLLRENNHLNSYLFLILSFFINIHAKLRLESSD